MKILTIGAAAGALSEENYLLAQTKFLHLASIDFSRFFRIGLSKSTPLQVFRGNTVVNVTTPI